MTLFGDTEQGAATLSTTTMTLNNEAQQSRLMTRRMVTCGYIFMLERYRERREERGERREERGDDVDDVRYFFSEDEEEI